MAQVLTLCVLVTTGARVQNWQCGPSNASPVLLVGELSAMSAQSTCPNSAQWHAS